MAPAASTIGSAANDAANKAAANVAKAAAQNTARQTGQAAKSGVVELKLYVQENPWSVKIFCFFTGMALSVCSGVGVVNIFGAAFKPSEWLTSLYNTIFGLVICICDGKPEWMN